MEEEYFHLRVAIRLPEDIRASVITLLPLQSLGLKMKQGGDNNELFSSYKSTLQKVDYFP